MSSIYENHVIFVNECRVYNTLLCGPCYRYLASPPLLADSPSGGEPETAFDRVKCETGEDWLRLRTDSIRRGSSRNGTRQIDSAGYLAS
jgi:hypothetical protein